MSKARMLATRLQGRHGLGFIYRIPRHSEDLDFTVERHTEGIEPNLVLLANALRQTASGMVEEVEADWQEVVRRRLEQVDWEDVRRDVAPFLGPCLGPKTDGHTDGALSR